MRIRESNIRSNPKNAASLPIKTQFVDIEESGSAEGKATAKQEYGGGSLSGLGGIGSRNFNRRNTSALHSVPQSRQDFKRSSAATISKHVSIKNFVAKR